MKRSYDQSWLLLGDCRGSNAPIFFPPGSPETIDERDARVAQAKAICRTCPVQPQCLDHALNAREPHGIWGGLDETERRALLTRRAG